jgi:hypothetical protein
MDFGSPEALYVSDMVSLSDAGRARVNALFETLRNDLHVIAEQEEAARLQERKWTGILMMVRPFEVGELTLEWRGKTAGSTLPQ